MANDAINSVAVEITDHGYGTPVRRIVIPAGKVGASSVSSRQRHKGITYLGNYALDRKGDSANLAVISFKSALETEDISDKFESAPQILKLRINPK